MKSRTKGIKDAFKFVPLTDPTFQYVRNANVQATWRKYGWVPPSEMKKEKNK